MMTFEEFKQLAIEPPRKQEKTIFRITVVTIDTWSLDFSDLNKITEEDYEAIQALSDEEREARRMYYPSFSVEDVCRKAYADTLEDAEQMVQRIATEVQDVYCIYVTEYPLNELLCWVGNYVTERVYGPDGKKIDERLFCDSFTDARDAFRHYRGRLPEQIRFKEGDIVEVLRGNKVTLEVVVGVPASVDWCYQYALKGLNSKYNPGKTDAEREQWAFGRGYMLDVTDDSYTVVDGPRYDYHDHPDALRVFAPRFPIPAEVEQKLRSDYEAIIKSKE